MLKIQGVATFANSQRLLRVFSFALVRPFLNTLVGYTHKGVSAVP